VIASVGKTLVHISVDRTTATTVGLLRRALADLADKYEKFAYLTMLEPGTQLDLPENLRESVNAYMRRYTSRFSASAVVFEQAGFQATVVRSLVTATHVAAQATHPSRVFEDLKSAATWLCGLTPGESMVRLYDAVLQLRRDAGVSSTRRPLTSMPPEKSQR
jgi:hypothetical protein